VLLNSGYVMFCKSVVWTSLKYVKIVLWYILCKHLCMSICLQIHALYSWHVFVLIPKFEILKIYDAQLKSLL